MKLKSRMRRTVTLAWAGLLAGTLGFAATAFAADKNSDTNKDKKTSGQVIDSGSFGVFIKGQRVVTETFNIHQENGNSIIKAQLKQTAGSDSSEQKSSLEITPSSELLRYEWSQAAGGSLTVLPKNEFLTETISTGSGKPAEQAYLMPNTSMILDNNFFVQREVLTWRYLAAACKPENGSLKCQKDPVGFGVLVPQDRTSLQVRMVLVGKEKVTIRGTERELLRLNLSGDGFEWGLWVDDQDQFKLMRIVIAADNTEVLRD